MIDEVWVHSKATDCKARYLSNFTHVPGDLTVAFGPGVERFASVELAYHAHKMLHLKEGPRIDLALRFTTSGSYGRLSGGSQKVAGGRGTFRKLGVVLDQASWNAAAPGIMRTLIEARSAVDTKFVDFCVMYVQDDHLVIRHYARNVFYRSKTTNELVGTDMLGPLLVDVGSGML